MKVNWHIDAKESVKGFILYLLLFAHIGLSGTTEVWSKYKSGDLQNAKREARTAVQSAKAPGTKSEALKLLGLIEFSLGERDQAKIHFAEAKSLSRNIKIDSKEALDPSVITFFNAIQPTNSAVRAPQQARANPPAARNKTSDRPPGTPTHSKPATVTKNQTPPLINTKQRMPVPIKNQAAKTFSPTKTMAAKPLAAPPMKEAPRKGTLLQIICNVKSASLSIDGILAGSANDLVTVKPGKVIFEVSASGYRTSRVTAMAIANTTTKVNVNLKEITPPKPAQPAKNKIAAYAPNPGNRPKAKNIPAKNRDMFGEDIPLVAPPKPAGGTNYQPAPTLPVRPAPAQAPQPNSPQYGNQMGAPGSQGNAQTPPGSYSPGQQFPQNPYYQQYPGQQFPMQQYPGQQFPMQQYPGQQFPGQAYPNQPYTIQGPGYPMPYQQAPIITVVPIYPNSNSSPVPPAPTYPALDPYAAMPPPAEVNSPNPFIETPEDSSYKSSFDSKPKPKKKKKSKKKSSMNFMYTILPFGGPQFIGGKPVLGAIFGASQAGALYYWYKSSNDAKNALADGTAEIARRDAEAGSAQDPQAYQDDTDAYKKTLAAYIKDKDSTATLSLVGFGATWALSFLESMIFGPAPQSASTADLSIDSADHVAIRPEETPVQFYLYPVKEGMSLGVSWKF